MNFGVIHVIINFHNHFNGVNFGMWPRQKQMKLKQYYIFDKKDFKRTRSFFSTFFRISNMLFSSWFLTVRHILVSSFRKLQIKNNLDSARVRASARAGPTGPKPSLHARRTIGVLEHGKKVPLFERRLTTSQFIRCSILLDISIVQALNLHPHSLTNYN